jgi:hypothetical protein
VLLPVLTFKALQPHGCSNADKKRHREFDFPEKLTISETTSRTPKINEAVLLISATDKGFSGKKRDNSSKI